ncbi:uncharacterized protein LOC114290141 [Camellia sinensis]|uniref:uncharacterized protein LOC114290141 n=1 Tax=Camellia sinensis TaxID=4442 RepID=UPI0010359D8B|nr:uncharacterized protein LOC114290141 [Camellia sinensis]
MAGTRMSISGHGKISNSNSANNIPSAFDVEDDKPLDRSVSKSNKDKAEFERVIAEVELKLKNSRLKKVSFPPPSSSASLGLCFNEPKEIYGSKKKRSTAIGSGSSNPVMQAFNIGARERLNGEMARMFYSVGLPFQLTRNPYYVSAFTFVANNNIQGYVPPGYNMLRTTLLQKERINIDRLLDPIRGTWREKGVSIASDGWSDSQQRPLINFMGVTGGGPMFLKAADYSGETKDKYFISNLMKEVIMEIGPKNVVQVITDNAPNYKVAGHLIEAQFPHIFWTPCVVYTLNLALKNICAAKNVTNNSVAFKECNWISEIVGDVMMIKNFICNHSMRVAMYNEFVSLKLLSVAETRFASSIVMLKRVKLIKQDQF